MNNFWAAFYGEVVGSPLQAVGTVLGLANSVLLIRRNIWNWPVGIASVTLLGMVFYHTALFSDTLLQGYFVVMQVLGWRAWLKHQEPDGELIVDRMTWRELGVWLAVTAAGAGALGYTTGHLWHAAFPYWDATVAAASVVGQVLINTRKLQNWWWWIGANVISITIYNLKGLHILSGLYLLYLLMAGWGWWEWRGRLRAQEVPA